MENLEAILTVSTIAGLATTLGSLCAILLKHPQEKLLAGLLAGACGIMASVVLLDLIPAAWQTGARWQLIPGLSAGLLVMHLAKQKLQPPSGSSPFNRRQQFKRLGVLVAAGIALHDLPEGMAIAIGQESHAQLGAVIALAIALHNFPEGMATATPLLMAKIRRWKIFALNLAIAVFTPLGAFIGLVALQLAHNSLSFFLALAAGAMSYLVLVELWPLSRELQPRYAVFSGCGGFILFSGMSLLLV
ncbi:MAG: ZIP family metal transporter [Peptococcaceae bacterium]|nr:ZIP family metal transporter [Peptococcaceae bacterium]